MPAGTAILDMHRLVIQHLAANHGHLFFEAKDFDAGVGWVEITDELCKDRPSGTVIHWIREVDGRLQVSATGVPIVTNMLMAIWRRSAAICPHCEDLRHPDICLP